MEALTLERLDYLDALLAHPIRPLVLDDDLRALLAMARSSLADRLNYPETPDSWAQAIPEDRAALAEELKNAISLAIYEAESAAHGLPGVMEQHRADESKQEALALVDRLAASTPPSAVPLTEERIIDVTEHIDTSRDGYFIRIARAIEAAHGIAAAPKEPKS